MTVSTLTVVPEATASGTAPCAEPEPLFALRRPRLLDLCCAAGGASAGYHAAGFDVVGVDIHPQPDYPFPFLHADALSVDVAGFDVVAVSPPCQRWAASTPADRRHLHPDLIDPFRQMLRAAVAAGLIRAYVIENVPGAPLREPVTVCGDSLRLGVRRHRLFESNLPLAGTGCWHDRPTPAVAVYGSYGQRTTATQPGATTEQARSAMGIDWMPWPSLTQAIPPAYTHWLGVQLITLLRTADDITRTRPVGFRHDVRGASVTPSLRHRVPADCVTPVDGVPSPTVNGIRHCPCGTPLPPRPATGRWPRFCSHACRQAAYRARKATR